MWLHAWVWAPAAVVALHVLSAYHEGQLASTLLELQFDHADLPPGRECGTLEFVLSDAALGDGERGLLYGELDVCRPQSTVERTLLGYVPEGFHTADLSHCEPLNNLVQAESDAARMEAWRQYSVLARQKQARDGGGGRRRRALQDGGVQPCPPGQSICACTAQENTDHGCAKLSVAPDRYQCFKQTLQGTTFSRFCVDSKQCLQPGDQACLQGQVLCMAARSGGLYGARCSTPCPKGTQCTPLVGGAGEGNCSAIPSALGGTMIGDTPNTASCWNEALTKAVLDGASQKFTQTFQKGYEGAAKLQEVLNGATAVRNAAFGALDNRSRALNATLATLLLQQATLHEQEQWLVGDLNASVRRANDAMQEYQERQGELAGQFEVQTNGVLQRLDNSNENMAADVAALQALLRQLERVGTEQAALLGGYTLDLAGLVDLARATLAEIRELQVRERNRRALAGALFDYAALALQQYGTQLFAEGGSAPRGSAWLAEREDACWFRFTVVLQFAQSRLGSSLSSSANLSAWALEDPEVRLQYQTYAPSAAELRPPGGGALRSVEEYWSLPGLTDGGVFSRYANKVGGLSTEPLQWLVLGTIRFFCHPEFLMEQSDNWFTFRDIMQLLGPADCTVPASLADPRLPGDCNCWVTVTRQRCLRTAQAFASGIRWEPGATDEAFLDLVRGGACNQASDLTADFYSFFPGWPTVVTLRSFAGLNQLLRVWCEQSSLPDQTDENASFANTNLYQLSREAELGSAAGSQERLGVWQRLAAAGAGTEACATHWADLEPQTKQLQERSGNPRAYTFPLLFYKSAQFATQFLRLKQLSRIFLEVYGDLPDDLGLGERAFFTAAPAQTRAPQLPPPLATLEWTPPPQPQRCATLTAAFATPELLPLWLLRHVETRQAFRLRLTDPRTGRTHERALEPVRRHQLPDESMLVLGYLACLHFWCGFNTNYGFVYDVLPYEVSGHPLAALRSTDYALFMLRDQQGRPDQNAHLLYPLGCARPWAGSACAPLNILNRPRVPLASAEDNPARAWKEQHGSARFEPTRAGTTPADSRKRLLEPEGGGAWQQRRCEDAQERGEGPLCELLRTHWWPDVRFWEGETLDNLGGESGLLRLGQRTWNERLTFRVPGTAFARRADLRSACPSAALAKLAPRAGGQEPGLRLVLDYTAEEAWSRNGSALHVAVATTASNDTVAAALGAAGRYVLDLPGTDAPAERVRALAAGTSGLLGALWSFPHEPAGPPPGPATGWPAAGGVLCWELSLDQLRYNPTGSFFTASVAGSPAVGSQLAQLQGGVVAASAAAAFAASARVQSTMSLLLALAGTRGQDPALTAGRLNDWQGRQEALRDSIIRGLAQNRAQVRDRAQAYQDVAEAVARALAAADKALQGFDEDEASLRLTLENTKSQLATAKNATGKLDQLRVRANELAAATGAALANQGLFEQVLDAFVDTNQPATYFNGQDVTQLAPPSPAKKKALERFLASLKQFGRDFWEELQDLVELVAACVKKGFESCFPDICKSDRKPLGFIPVPNKGPMNRKAPTCVVLRWLYYWAITILAACLVLGVLVCVLRCVVCGGCCGGCGRRQRGSRRGKKSGI